MLKPVLFTSALSCYSVFQVKFPDELYRNTVFDADGLCSTDEKW